MFRFHMVNPLDTMQREMEQLFRGFDLNPPVRQQGQVNFRVQELDEGYQVAAELPGLDIDKLEIDVVGRKLSIKGEFVAPQLPEGVKIHRQERRIGSFERILTLPDSLDTDNIDAEYKEGILAIRLPKSRAALPKKIAIKAE